MARLWEIVGAIVVALVLIVIVGKDMTLKGPGEHVAVAPEDYATPSRLLDRMCEMVRFDSRRVYWREQIIASGVAALWAVIALSLVQRQPITLLGFLVVFVSVFLALHFLQNFRSYHGFARAHADASDDIRLHLVSAFPSVRRPAVP